MLSRASFLPLLLLAGVLAGSAVTLAPSAFQGWRALAAKGEAELTDVQLEAVLTEERFSREIDAALDAADDELAQSFLDLGAARGYVASEAQKTGLEAVRQGAGERAVQDFTEGFVRGGVASGAGMAGALVGDLSGYGDARDLWHEAGRLSRGEEPDHVVMGAAAAGLALSAAAWSSLGAALPARGGLTLVKSAQKAGKLSRPLVAAITATAAKTIDREALTASLKAAGRLDVEAAKLAAGKAMRAEALSAFREIGRDAATLYQRLGARGATQAFAVAANEAELRAAAKLAVARGGKTRAILATLGRGALAAGVALTAAAEAFALFVAVMVGLALAARGLGVSLARLLPPKK